MKNRIVHSACTVLVAVSLFSCSDDKKNSSKEVNVEQASPITENTNAGSTQLGLHPIEQKFDAFMTTYINKMKAAFDEPDDAKSIAMLEEMSTEMNKQGEALKSELEQWGNSLSESEKEAVKKRMEDKPYMNTLYEVASNPNFLQRLAKSQKLKEAYDKAGEGFEKLEIETE